MAVILTLPVVLGFSLESPSQMLDKMPLLIPNALHTARLLDLSWPVLKMVGNAFVGINWLVALLLMRASVARLAKAIRRRLAEAAWH
jgi:hypothetical protein